MKKLSLRYFSLSLLFIFFFCKSENTFAQRYWNTAAKFNYNDNSYIAVAPGKELSNLSGSFTVEFWYNWEVYGAIFEKGGFSMDIYPLKNGKVVAEVNTRGNLRFSSGVSSAMDRFKWYHLACTYDSTTGLMAFYINGMLDTSATIADKGPLANNDSLFIGGHGPNYYGYFGGMLDDFRISNQALSPYEMLYDYRHPYVGYLTVNNPNFPTHFILSCCFDNQFTGPFNNLHFFDGENNFISYNVQAVDLGQHPSQTIIVNSSLNIPGGTGYVTMPTNADIELTGPMTIEAWIYPQNVTGTEEYIVDKKGGWNDPGYAIYYSLDNNVPKIRFKNNGTGIFSNSTVPLNKWTYVAATIASDNTVKIYINGLLDVTGALPFAGANTDSLYIGNILNGTSSNNFNGYIDAVRISNYAKTQSEIQKNMFNIVDITNNPQAPNSTVSIDFEYYNSPSTGNGYYNFIGTAAYSNEYYDNSPIPPVSPLLGNNYPGFPGMFTIKSSDRRIPQFNTAGYTEDDSLNISNTGKVADVKMFLALEHADLHDLQIYLFNPDGDSAMVWNQNYGELYCNSITTVFDDNSPDTLIDGRYIDFGPSVKPFSSLNQAFSGKNSQGTWRLKIVDLNNGSTGYLYGWGLKVTTATGINNKKLSPHRFELSQNYPNPFNPSTKIKYSIPNSPLPFGKGLGVRLEVYDILGREVATLVNEKQRPGNYEVTFDGAKLSSGIYFYKLQAGSFVQTKKMILLK